MQNTKKWFEKIKSINNLWLLVLVILIVMAYVPVLFSTPHPFYDSYVPPENNWFDVILRSSYLRLNDLPGLAEPLSSGPVGGHDYVYTSLNIFSQLVYIVPLALVDIFADFSNEYVFLIATRILMFLVNVLAIYSLYRLLLLVFRKSKSNLRILSLLLFASWPILTFLDSPRWFPLILLLTSLATYCSIKLIEQFNKKYFIWNLVLLFSLACIHYYGMVFAIALSLYLLIVTQKKLRKKIALLLLVAILGAIIHTAPVYYYTHKYDRVDDTGTGSSAITYYIKKLPAIWKTVTLATLGKKEFHVNLHGTIPNMLSDVTTTLLPTPPQKFTKTREVLGFRWSRWSNYMGEGNWYKYQLAIVGFFSQLVLLTLFFFIFFGKKFFKIVLRLKFSRFLTFLRNQQKIDPAKKILYFIAIINILLYIFLFFRIEQELHARHGILFIPLAILMAELMSRISTNSSLKIRQMIYLTIFIAMSLFYQIDSKLIKPQARPDYQPYMNLVEWSRNNTNNRQIYFDFSDYYYLPAQVMIDGPVPMRTYAYPNLTNNWSYEETYGDESTLIIGISAGMLADKDKELSSNFSVGKTVTLTDIPTGTMGIYYMPKRPKDSKVKLEYFERVEIPEKNRFIYFYAGEIFTDVE